MYKTIRITARLFVQGLLVQTLDDGKLQIRVGKRLMVGYPV